MTIDDAITIEMKPTTFDWWGHTYTDMVPALCTERLDDGQILLGFSSMSSRPNYYLICVDSSFVNLGDEMTEYIGEYVIPALEDCFDWIADDDEEEDERGWPVLMLDSGYTSFVIYPKQED